MSASTIERQTDNVTECGHGREPAICELRCTNCGDGLRFDQYSCDTCGQVSQRFTCAGCGLALSCFRDGDTSGTVCQTPGCDFAEVDMFDA